MSVGGDAEVRVRVSDIRKALSGILASKAAKEVVDKILAAAVPVDHPLPARRESTEITEIDRERADRVLRRNGWILQ